MIRAAVHSPAADVFSNPANIAYLSRQGFDDIAASTSKIALRTVDSVFLTR